MSVALYCNAHRTCTNIFHHWSLNEMASVSSNSYYFNYILEVFSGLYPRSTNDCIVTRLLKQFIFYKEREHRFLILWSSWYHGRKPHYTVHLINLFEFLFVIMNFCICIHFYSQFPILKLDLVLPLEQELRLVPQLELSSKLVAAGIVLPSIFVQDLINLNAFSLYVCKFCIFLGFDILWDFRNNKARAFFSFGNCCMYYLSYIYVYQIFGSRILWLKGSSLKTR